ncbi:hypothetical protein QQ045_016492 [Rhodiola kirilowii]
MASPHPLNPPDSKGVASRRGKLSESVSFAAAVPKPRLTPRLLNVPLPSRQYGFADGKPVIRFTMSEFEAGVALFKYSLIVNFTIRRPPWKFARPYKLIGQSKEE